jgi:thymidylate kinase
MSAIGDALSDLRSPRPLLVTFSGIDGSGKSTQIDNLKTHLRAQGLRYVQLAFWDDIVVGKRYREAFVYRVYKSEKGVGAPGKPVNRQDKNVRRWYLSIARHVLYLLDSIHLCEVVARARRGSPDVVIVDRYIYDQLANLPLKNPFTRLFIRAVHAFVPRPDLAYLLDADVEAAVLRKPEYPVEFLRKCRAAYFELARQLKTIEIIPAAALADARRAVLTAFDEIATRRNRNNSPQPVAA